MTDAFRKKQKRYRKYTKEMIGWVVAVVLIIAGLGAFFKWVNYYGEETRVLIRTEITPRVKRHLEMKGYEYKKLSFVGEAGRSERYDYDAREHMLIRIYEATDLVTPAGIYMKKAKLYYETPPREMFYGHYAFFKKLERVE